MSVDIAQPTQPTYKVAVSYIPLMRKIPPGDALWRTFNASFTNLSIAPFDLAAKVYDGLALTTWHKDHWRSGDNFILGQHIGLDMDTEDERSTLTQLCKDPFIAKYASFLYTTISHTSEKPRGRVIFLLDTPIMQAKNYTLAASALLWLFGTADRQCRDAVRFFYGARGCDVEYFDNVLPLTTIKHLIAQYQESGQRERQRHTGEWATTADQNEVADALRLIPAWGIDYDEWVQVLMGIHAGFGDAGLSLAETWADGAPNEVARKWASFKANGNYAGAVTVATVFGIAKRFGWRKHETV